MSPVSIINLGDPAGKSVGRRRGVNPLCSVAYSIIRAKEWQKALPVKFPPKGVYRFKTHEEANEWMRNNTRLKAN